MLVHSQNFKYDHSAMTEKTSEEPSLTTPDMSYSIRNLLEKFTSGITPPVMREGKFDEDATFENYDITRNGDFDLADASQMKAELQASQEAREAKYQELLELKKANQKSTIDAFNKWKLKQAETATETEETTEPLE